MGLALGRVRDAGLHRAHFPTFEDDWQVKWEYGPRHLLRSSEERRQSEENVRKLRTSETGP